jgi:hypothetical protein
VLSQKFKLFEHACSSLCWTSPAFSWPIAAFRRANLLNRAVKTVVLPKTRHDLPDLGTGMIEVAWEHQRYAVFQRDLVTRATLVRTAAVGD